MLLASAHLRRLSILSLHYQSRFFFLPDLSRTFCIVTNDHGFLDFLDHLLQECKNFQQLKQIHTHFVVTGSSNSSFLAARLISAYSRFGQVFDAQYVFESTPFDCVWSSLLWNSILRVKVSNGYYENALKLYVKMRKLGVLPDGFTFPLVLRASKHSTNFGHCKIIHNHVLQMGLQGNLHVVNELIGIYARMGQMDFSRILFDKMPVRNYVTWNTMVSGFALNYDCDGALCIFRSMESEGMEPNLVTWTSLLSSHARCGKLEETLNLFGKMRLRNIEISAEALALVLSVCADLVSFEKGMMIHGYAIKGGFEKCIIVKNALICVYGKHGDVDGARNLFLGMDDKNIVSWNVLITTYAEAGLCDEAFSVLSELARLDDDLKPNVISWSVVINGFASNERGDESLYLFRKMQLAKVKANSVTISSVLSACANLSALNAGREVHGHVIRALMDSNIFVGNGLLNMYMKCGCLEKGWQIFENLSMKDLVSWNSLITGYGMNGFGKNAIAIFEEMIDAGFKPDSVTFIAVLSACSHTGLMEKGRRIFDSMAREFGIEPQMEHYACMVDLYGRAGLLQEASEMVKNMPMVPNACVWGAILNSCRMHRNANVAEEMALRIFGLDTNTTGSYMLLSSVYAESGRWDDFARVRVLAKEKGLKKVAGKSWIELKKKVHVFSSGNGSELDLKEVYKIIEELVVHMETEGYVFDDHIFMIS